MKNLMKKMSSATILIAALLLPVRSSLAQGNMAPVLPVVGDQTVNELTQLTVVQTATEADTNATLSYPLVVPRSGASAPCTPSALFSVATCGMNLPIQKSSNSFLEIG